MTRLVFVLTCMTALVVGSCSNEGFVAEDAGDKTFAVSAARKAGDVSRYDVTLSFELESKYETEQGDSVSEAFSMDCEAGALAHVKQVDHKKNMTLGIQLYRLQMTGELDGQEFEMTLIDDEAILKENDESVLERRRDRILGRWAKMKKEAVRIKTDARGSVLEIDTTNVLGPLGRSKPFFSGDCSQFLLLFATPYFPDESIAVGQTWEAPQVTLEPEAGGYTFITSYTVEDYGKYNGQECLKIQQKTTLDDGASGSFEAELYVNPANGALYEISVKGEYRLSRTHAENTGEVTVDLEGNLKIT